MRCCFAGRAAVLPLPKCSKRRRCCCHPHPIPGDIAALRVLNLNSNHLYGSLPPDLSRLSSLEQLLLGGNRCAFGCTHLGRMPAGSEPCSVWQGMGGGVAELLLSC